MTAKQQKALADLLAAPNKTEAARAAGISPRTLRAYLSDPAFHQAYQQAFAGLMEDATRQVQQSIAPAISTLKTIVEDNYETAQARTSAARALLEYSLKLTEQTDILTRLDEIEREVHISDEKS